MHHQSTIERVCRQCGQTFQARRRSVAVGYGNYCSHACHNRSRAIDAITRFWSLVDKRGPDECWPWLGTGGHLGHGHFTVSGRNVGAHRFAYELAHGTVPDGLFICHHCDNPSCCNPAHLFAGTITDNHRDMVSKGRQLKGEQFPQAKLTDDGVREVRRLRMAGLSQQAIADRFGVSQVVISLILRGKTWKHVV